MGVTALAIIQLRNLFAVVMLSGIYSFLAASMFVVMDAVDVAFTEASVGAGISTVLSLAVLALMPADEKPSPKIDFPALLIVLITGSALIYATIDMPAFGDPMAPANLHVAPRYIEDSMREIGIPNIVTSVLASYRGYDTLGEVTVIFTAGIAVMMLLMGTEPENKSRKKHIVPEDDL